MVLACKKQLERNPPPKGIKQEKGKQKGDLITISPSEHIKANPNKEFAVRNSRLFCCACREEIATKKTLKLHIRKFTRIAHKISKAREQKK